MPPPTHPPPALTHATAAAAGTLLSTLLTYPLDLVTTRLKVQRQVPLSSDPNDKQPTLLSAFRTILHDADGDPRALYAGLRIDLVKSVVDSFLFFLFYTVRPRAPPSRIGLPLGGAFVCVCGGMLTGG